MPKVPIDYSKTIIYKIVCKDLNIDYTYVGQTTNLNKRRNQHKHSCNNENDRKYNYPVYQKIRENCGWSYWSVIEIEKYPCKDYNEAGARERFFIEQLGTLNKVIPTRTHEEYRSDNRTAANERSKIYYENNTEVIAEKQKKYTEQNKKKIAERRKIHYEKNKEHIAEYHKEYYQTNKEKAAEKQQIYRENNKEAINAKKKIIVKCECGCEVTKSSISTHKKSNKHIKCMNGNPVSGYKGERVKCECGIEISKDSMYRHKKTKKHINLMENLPKSE